MSEADLEHSHSGQSLTPVSYGTRGTPAGRFTSEYSSSPASCSSSRCCRPRMLCCSERTLSAAASPTCSTLFSSASPASLHSSCTTSHTCGEQRYSGTGDSAQKHGLFCWLRPCPHQRGYEDTQRHTHTDTETQRHTHRDTHTERHTHRPTQRQTHTETHTETHTQRHTLSHTHTPHTHLEVQVSVDDTERDVIFGTQTRQTFKSCRLSSPRAAGVTLTTL